MYMDEKTVRTPGGRSEGELLRRLLGEEEGRRDGCPRRYPCTGARTDRCILGTQGDRCENALGRPSVVQPRRETDYDGCGCGEGIGAQTSCGANGVSGRPLAMVYAPVQAWQDLYEPHAGWGRGTIFRELDLPFEGERRVEGGGNRHGC